MVSSEHRYALHLFAGSGGGAGTVNGLFRKNGRNRLDQLVNYVKYWRTPDCAKGGTVSDEVLIEMSEGNFTRPDGSQRQLRLQDQVRFENQDGQLNPDWVEWLMVWAIGWTGLEPLSTVSFEDWKNRVSNGLWNGYDPAELLKDGPGYIPRLTENRTHRADRLKAIGNGQVPLCVYFASLMLEIVQDLFKKTKLRMERNGTETEN